MRNATRIVIGILLGILLTAGIVSAQNVVNGPPPAGAEKKADAPKETLPNVPLTEIEQLKVENNQLKAERLQLQIGNLQAQVTSAQNELTGETAALTQQILKAHNLEPGKYHVDATAKACVPNGSTPPAPPAAKPTVNGTPLKTSNPTPMKPRRVVPPAKPASN